jgi:nucleotide-binding universal stress UspA family protein
MNGWKRVLVPLDGSDLSRWVLDRGKFLLTRPGVSVTLMSVIPSEESRAVDLAYQVDPRHRPAHDALALLRDELLRRSVACEARLRLGDPAAEIVREVREGDHDLVAMTTHGRTGLARVLFGSVALRVLQASPAPTFLFRPLQRPDGTLSPVETSDPARFRRILVPLDGSEAAEEILPAARSMAETFGTKLVLFRAVPGGPYASRERAAAEEELGRLEHRFASSGIVALVEVRTGSAAEEALALIREMSLEAVALTTHGRTGLPRALYGSVAERLLRDAGVPVLAIRNRKLARAAAPAPLAAPRHVRVD